MAKRKTANETSDNRIPMWIPLTPAANEIVNGWCDRTGGSKSRFIQRLIEWYASAPGSLRSIIDGNVPEDMRREYAEKSAEYFARLVNAGNSPADDDDLYEINPPPQQSAPAQGLPATGATSRKGGPKQKGAHAAAQKN